MPRYFADRRSIRHGILHANRWFPGLRDVMQRTPGMNASIYTEESHQVREFCIRSTEQVRRGQLNLETDPACADAYGGEIRR